MINSKASLTLENDDENVYKALSIKPGEPRKSAFED